MGVSYGLKLLAFWTVVLIPYKHVTLAVSDDSLDSEVPNLDTGSRPVEVTEYTQANPLSHLNENERQESVGNGQEISDLKVEDGSRKEDSTNPPFPSQSSSFWEHETEDVRDYGESSPTDAGETVAELNKPRSHEEPDKEDSTRRKSSNRADERPNIILIITDDQDIELGSMEYMPETLKVFRDQGVEFRHGYVSTPICCPSRSSLLTGLYVHNHEVFTNNDNCSSISWREKYEKKTFASHLWSSGYYTSYIGKYLNKYDGSHIPYGWDEWNGLLMNSRYYNYTLNRNGKRYRYGHDLEHDYYPDNIARDALDFLNRVAADPNKRPFLLVLSFPSPHGPEDSAPRYSNLFLNATPHHTPSYNYAPNSDKQWILRITDKMNPMLKEFTNLLMTKRLQTLQSVDIAVRDIFQKLDSESLRDSTYAFYTSDHGYHVGQFGLVKGKSMPYEFDIRVPFFMTGPKAMVNAGSVIREPVLNIDFAPTFLDLANLPVPEEMDGRSMVPLIRKYCPACPKEDPFEWPDVFLIESPGRRNPPGNSDGGSGESFDKQNMRRGNKRKNREKIVVDDDEVLSLKHLCTLHPHPCLPGQKKYCRKEKNRIRFRKCRQNIDFLVSSRMFGPDARFNDPVYRHSSNSNSTSETPNQMCSCRFKRSTLSLETVDDEDELNWEVERKRIDDEIEKLKQRIEYLRQRRKEMRRKWLAENSPKENNGTRSDVPSIMAEGRGRHREDRKHKEHTVTDEDENERDEEYDVSNESEETTRDDKEEEEDSLEEKTENKPEVNAEIDLEDKINYETGHSTVREETSSTEPTNINGNITQDGEEAGAGERDHHHVEFIDSASNERQRHEQEEDDKKESAIPTVTVATPRKPHGHHRNKNKNTQNRNKMKGIYLLNKNSRPTEENDHSDCNCYNDPKWLRQKEREDRKHRKILSKLRKKQRLFQRIEDPVERQQAETCDKTGKEEKMNCFWHDSDHWRTRPFWTSGSFCFCMNANNNSYSCLRSVNGTHNYLYCQFVTGFKMYFDLMQDPYQLKNTIDTLPASSEDWIMARLYKLKQCKGRDECWSDDLGNEDSLHPSLWEQIFGRWPKKRKRGGRRRKYQGN